MRECVLRRPHPPMRDRTDCTVQNHAMRDEPAHRRVARCHQSVGLRGRHRRNDVHPLFGQCCHRCRGQIGVGLLLRRRRDEDDGQFDRGQPIGNGVRPGIQHAGSDHLHRVAPIGVRILKRLGTREQDQRRPAQKLVHRGDRRTTHVRANRVDRWQHHPLEHAEHSNPHSGVTHPAQHTGQWFETKPERWNPRSSERWRVRRKTRPRDVAGVCRRQCTPAVHVYEQCIRIDPRHRISEIGHLVCGAPCECRDRQLQCGKRIGSLPVV